MKEYVVGFFDSMGPFIHDADLCLNEFLKSLADRAYTWCVNLESGSIHDWEHMLSIFNTKFFLYGLAKLGHTRQFPSEDLNLYERIL